MRVISDPQVHCGWTTSDGHAAGPAGGTAVQTPTPLLVETIPDKLYDCLKGVCLLHLLSENIFPVLRSN